eukprot:164158-Prymnesium_polylepis.1
MAAHSDFALRRLDSLAVRGLEALPYDHDLEAIRRRSPSQQRAVENLRHFLGCILLYCSLAMGTLLDCSVICAAVACSDATRDALTGKPLFPLFCAA